MACQACGFLAARHEANYCLVCGKTLSENYRPLDRIRSSNRLQGKSFLVENAESEEINDLFEVNRNSVSEAAWASCVYSMVPYLGIVFVPFTVLAATAGIGVALRHPKAGGRRLAAESIVVSFFVLAVQILLWWLLYIVPDLSRNV
jgi:hypothetical protein